MVTLTIVNILLVPSHVQRHSIQKFTMHFNGPLLMTLYPPIQILYSRRWNGTTP
jgi:hypothetical protein